MVSTERKEIRKEGSYFPPKTWISVVGERQVCRRSRLINRAKRPYESSEDKPDRQQSSQHRKRGVVNVNPVGAWRERSARSPRQLGDDDRAGNRRNAPRRQHRTVNGANITRAKDIGEKCGNGREAAAVHRKHHKQADLK